MEVVDLSGQRKVLDTEILRNVVNGFRAILSIVLESLQAGPNKGEDFGWIGFDLFYRRPDAP